MYVRSDGTKVVMDSSWEHICATKLDEAGIRWIRNHDLSLPYYVPTGAKKNYIPDFYLPDHDLYLEIKGFWTMQSRHKMADVKRRNAVDILIIESMAEVTSVSTLIQERVAKRGKKDV